MKEGRNIRNLFNSFIKINILKCLQFFFTNNNLLQNTLSPSITLHLCVVLVHLSTLNNYNNI